MMRVSVFLGICFVVAVGSYMGGSWYSQRYMTSLEPVRLVSKERRIIPTDADFGAYLAGLLARENQDVSKASEYYSRVYHSDPQNKDVQSDLYLIAGLAGDIDDFMHVAEKMAQETHSYYAPLFLTAQAIKQERYEDALHRTPIFKKMGSVQKILYPVIRAWSYAGLERYQQAINALIPLKQEKETEALYWYQRAMISIFSNKTAEAREAFSVLKDMEVPTVTTLQAARWFFKGQNEWTADHPWYHKYFNNIKENQSLSEILITRADEFNLKTPAQGVADVFFAVSLWADEQQKSAETGILFSQMAVYLNNQSSTYKIWAAEQFEAVKYYSQANKMYDSLDKPSATISFKKALNLLLLGQTDEAEHIFDKLSLLAPNDVTLASMQGDLYRDTKRYPQAIQKYSSVLKETPKTDAKKLSDLYFSRAVVYDGAKQPDKRDVDLAQALKLTPNNVDILNYQGYVWIEENKNIAQAMEYIYQAHSLAPKEPHIWDSLAWGYYKQGQLEQALIYAEQAADGMPYSALVQAHLGDIYRALGRKREAGYQYHKALNLKADMTEELRSELTSKMQTN